MAINERQKWPTNKAKYDESYIKIFGRKCPTCKGVGQVGEELFCYSRSMGFNECTRCNGTGCIEDKK